MVALFAGGVRVMHDGKALATVKAQTRATVKADALADAVEGLLAAFPQVAATFPEFAAAVAALPSAVITQTTFPVVRTK
jgi:urease gamma subunit